MKIKKYTGSAWIDLDKPPKKYAEYTDEATTLPVTIQVSGDDVSNYQVYGASGGVGEQTENLFDKDAKDTNNGYRASSYLLEDGTETISTSGSMISEYITIPSGVTTISLLVRTVGSVTNPSIVFYDMNKTYLSGERYASRQRFTINVPNDAVFIRLSGYSTTTLVLGSTAPDHYIPYGYKIPISLTDGTSTSNYDLFIGSTKLGKEEHIDFAEQKVYKLKEVHKDTVTIDGVVWDILGYDHDEVYDGEGNLAQHTVTIQAHNCIRELQFDAPEAWYYAESGLAAGTYYFTIDPAYDASHNTYKDTGYQFTLANDVPAGGVLTFPWSSNAQASGVKVSAYASRSATTATESVSVSSGTTGTNLGQLTTAGDPANNLNSIQRVRYGSNNWKQSAMRQYLNSDKAAGNFWTPQTKFDRPPSWNASADGFLRGVDPDFVSVLGKVNKITGLNTVTDGGGTETTSEKVFLLSHTEAYCGGSEGTAYDYYKNYSDLSAAGSGADTNRIKYRNGTAKYWWLRSPYPSGAYSVRLINPSGTLYINNAFSASGVVPACCIILDDINTNPYLQSLFLKPTDPPVPLPAVTTTAGTYEVSVDTTVAPEKTVLEYKGWKGIGEPKVRYNGAWAMRPYTLYGWHVDPSISDPAQAITYLEDAVGKTPAAMGASTFSYGSWEDAFFMPRPCMLKYDGTVDYYLDPNDYTKKADGTASDIADPTYGGNAMMEWPLIWYKYEAGETEGEGYFYCSDKQADDTFKCWCNINSANEIVEHFYTSIFPATGTDKFRSLSGVQLTTNNGCGNTSGGQEAYRAEENNTSAAKEWYTDVWCDRSLISGLLVLLGKSLDVQAVFGNGRTAAGESTKTDTVNGVHNDKGLFYGSTTGWTTVVKVFGMENWWGAIYRRTAGLVGTSGGYAYKLTYGTADGSSITGYNSDGGFYRSAQVTRPSGHGYITKMAYGAWGYVPIASGSSGFIYYTDYTFVGNHPLLTGGVSVEDAGGTFFSAFATPINSSVWYVGTGLSCKPIAEEAESNA